VGLGANLGDPVAGLRAAALDLDREAGGLVATSRIYLSDPVGVLDQPPFRNAVAAVRTHLAPDELLDLLLALEARHGRVRGRRWGPRTLDLDLVWYEGVERDSGRLVLPHPRAHEREFVLRPLCDLDPGVVLRGRPAADWLAALEPQGVEATGDALM
jgi:2-amino-4-hydroxy-6-hydroxymethyldihydropteridine diphosphokinase